MLKKKALLFISAVTLSLVGFTATASAHVSVKPAESAAGSWETYTMKVPVEKNEPTTKVVLKMPAGVEFQQYQPIPGWKTSVSKHDDKAVSVTWEAKDGGIQPGQFQQFTFVAKNPEKSGDAAWDAYQYYKDGSIVEWTGDEKADTPHSITKITKSASVTDAHGAEQSNEESKSGVSALDIAAIVLSAAAIILSIAALVKKKRV
ncbi:MULTISPECIES: YcnI family protein [Bacillus amyloliquefaciens group]|uniref:YcnI family copper-binding membrane protein n=1 Tax=Bacillus amyloliquefaciens group TaxID=1938374 RepID=UPI00397F3C84